MVIRMAVWDHGPTLLRDITMRIAGSHRLLLACMVVTGALLGPAPAHPQPATIGSVDLITSRHGQLSNVEIAVRMSEATPGSATTVVIGRDDVFADALASGPLQADGPLLLVPRDGPVPERVRREIVRLGARTATILGGAAAVSQAVADELTGMGLAVDRLAGGSRLETAIAIAASASPSATTALLVRAFPSEGAPQSQAFADSLGAGGLSTTADIPILLTESDRLSEATAAHLTSSAIATVRIVGGTAAVSASVQDAVEALGISTDRIAGPSRFATGIAMAQATEAEIGGPPARVVVASAEGDDAWAGGFAAARHAALTGGVIVFARVPADVPPAPAGQLFSDPLPLPEETAAYVAGTRFAGPEGLVPGVTCVALPGACETVQTDLGHPATPRWAISPPGFVGCPAAGCGDAPGLVEDGTAVVLDVPPGEPDAQLVSTCGPVDELSVTLQIPRSGGCSLRVLGPGEYFVRVDYFDALDAEELLVPDRPPRVATPELVSADPATGAATGIDLQEGVHLSDDGRTIAWATTGRCAASAPQPTTVQGCVERDGERVQLGLRDDGTFVTSPTPPRALDPSGSTVAFGGPPGLADEPGGGGSCCIYAMDVDTGATDVVSIDVEGNRLSSVVPGTGHVQVYDNGNRVLMTARGVAEPGAPAGDHLFVRIRDQQRTIALRDADGQPLSFDGEIRVTELDETRGRAFAWVSGSGGRPTFVVIDLDSGAVEDSGLGATDGTPIPWAGPSTGFGDASSDLEVRVQEGVADGSSIAGRPLAAGQTHVVATVHGGDGTVDLLPGVASSVTGGPVGNARNAAVSSSGGFVTVNVPTPTADAQRVDAGYPRDGCGVWTTDIGTGTTVRADVPGPDGRYGNTCTGFLWVGDDGTTCMSSDVPMDPDNDGPGTVDLYCAPELQATTFDLSLQPVTLS